MPLDNKSHNDLFSIVLLNSRLTFVLLFELSPRFKIELKCREFAGHLINWHQKSYFFQIRSFLT